MRCVHEARTLIYNLNIFIMATHVINLSEPTAGQQQEYWKQIKESLITREILQEFLERKKFFLPPKTAYLRLIAQITIDATKAGSEKISDNINDGDRRLFDIVENDFWVKDTLTPSRDTQSRVAYVYQRIRRGTYAEIFSSLPRDLDLLSFETHEQIRTFIANDFGSLPLAHRTFLLFTNKKGEYFVAHVGNSYEGEFFTIGVDDFLDESELSLGEHHFIVFAEGKSQTQA